MSVLREAPPAFEYSDAPELCHQSPALTKALISEPYSEITDPPKKPVDSVDPSLIVLRRTTFWVMLVGIVVLFAATIGGSVGAALGTKAHDNSDKSVTTIPANNSTSLLTPVPQTSCPNSDNTIFHPTVYSDTSQAFRIECGTDYTNSQNIVQIMVYTLEDCITACATYNFWNLNRNCTYVSYLATNGDPGNCWLEHGNPGPKLDSTNGTNTTYALLQK
ncbi:hypothetical protein F5884DRAFT_757919 [Xylogone sp. PMI_703]|nr:hypothetical protein F5884DRAFT_757919 [Xylogone sp. PMI_703]